MKVIITPRAEAQLAKRRAWWREHRDKAPDLFDRELAETVARLGRMAGSLLTHSVRSGHEIRRYLMPKTRCHLYLEVVEADGHVLVLAAGGGQRKRPPTFRLQDAL